MDQKDNTSGNDDLLDKWLEEWKFTILYSLLAIGFFPSLGLFYLILYIVSILPFIGIILLIAAFIEFWVDAFVALGIIIAGESVPFGIAVSRLARSYMALVMFFGLTYFLLEHYSPGSLGISDKHAIMVIDPYYFSLITVSTIGYGDIYPIGTVAKFLVMIEVVAGVIFNVTIFGIATAFFVERFKKAI
jgi:Ion channel